MLISRRLFFLLVKEMLELQKITVSNIFRIGFTESKTFLHI